MAKKGRPSKKKTISLRQVERLAEVGLIEDQIASILDIHPDTLNNYKKKKSPSYWPEFFEALKKGKAKSDSKVEESLYNRALGYEHPEDKIFCTKNGRIVTAKTIKHYPPDSTAMIFWLKNRRKDLWRDKTDLEHSGHLAVTVINKIPRKNGQNHSS